MLVQVPITLERFREVPVTFNGFHKTLVDLFLVGQGRNFRSFSNGARFRPTGQVPSVRALMEHLADRIRSTRYRFHSQKRKF